MSGGRLRIVPALVVGLTILLAACAPAPVASTIRTGRSTALAGTVWRLVSIQGRQTPAGADVTLAFDADRVSGDGGCNSYGGAYEYDPATGDIRIGDLVSTKRACAEPLRNEFETVFFEALRGAVTTTVDETGRLVVAGSGAEFVLEVAGVQVKPPVTPSPSS